MHMYAAVEKEIHKLRKIRLAIQSEPKTETVSCERWRSWRRELNHMPRLGGGALMLLVVSMFSTVCKLCLLCSFALGHFFGNKEKLKKMNKNLSNPSGIVSAHLLIQYTPFRKG